MKNLKQSEFRKKWWKEHPKISGFNVPTEQFLDIKTKEVAYFLGYFWADGSFRNTSINLEIKEEDGIVIKDSLNKLGKWNIRTRQRRKNNKNFGKVQMIFNTSNRLLVEFLKSMNYSNKSKASPTLILSNIPKELHSYFWHGYLDGDGCIYVAKKNELAFWGTYEQDWKELKSLFDLFNIKYSIYFYERKTKSGKIHRSSCFLSCHRKNIIKILDWILSDTSIGLPRKIDKYKLMKSNDDLANRRVAPLNNSLQTQ